MAPAGELAAYAKDPNATGPLPGTPTSSRTTAAADTASHQRRNVANRFSPYAVELATRPQPTIPSPRRTHENRSLASAAGNRCSSGVTSATGRVMLRATSGVGALARTGRGMDVIRNPG